MIRLYELCIAILLTAGLVHAADQFGANEEESLVFSLLTIAISEIGDKTFLIAAVMAMKPHYSRLAVFSGAFVALALMAVLSSWLGSRVVPNLIPKSYTDLAASVLFFGFGVRMLWEGWHMTHDCRPDEEAVANELKRSEEEGGYEEHSLGRSVFMQTLLLTFLGEWGDKSQISTIALAASNNVYMVAAGVIVGHAVCTALAVLGGCMLASKISVRTVTLAGAFLFMIFGVIHSYHYYRSQFE